MRRITFLLLALAVAALLGSSAALAKGASEATITGPGLGDGITLAGEGQSGGDRLVRLAEHAGFFPAVFVTTPNSMLSRRPTGNLGPRYTIEYTMPGPNGVVNRLRQDLYPYASPLPVTFMEPGQAYFGTEKAVGGWFVASHVLKDELVAVGLSQAEPGGSAGGVSLPWLALGALGVATGVAVGVLLVARRRATPTPLAS